MKSMPIRLRLTLWYCFIFGIILTVIVSALYYTHTQSQYKAVDMMITNISAHVLEDINRQLDEGNILEELKVSIDVFSVDNIAILLKDKNGEIIKKKSNSYFGNDQHIESSDEVNYFELQTVTDDSGERLRKKNTPIFQDKEIIGYVETLYSLYSLDRSIQTFKWIVIGLTVIGIALAAIAGWILAKRTLWRVDLIGKTAKAIAVSQDFEQRVLYIGPPDELGQLTETFNQMLDSLETAYKNQKRFLSDVSHELRAPLTTIRGNLDILYKMKNIPELEKDEILSDIRSEVVRMSKLVSDLLSLARADAGQKFKPDLISLSSIAHEVIDEIEKWKKDVQVDAQIKGNVNLWGDRNLIKQLLIILLDNAIKYTPSKGNIFLTITVEGQQGVIVIKDEGIGISPEDVFSIYERFYRTKEAREFSPDGTGLGLSIAKWIVEEHKGEIEVKSKMGKGTEFIINLPLVT